MSVTVKIKPPRVPNFLFDEHGDKYPVSALAEMELRELGKEWMKNLIYRAREQELGHTNENH